MHRHGSYQRLKHTTGDQRIRIQRFLCTGCQGTVSVLPADRLPYRSLTVSQLEAFFDRQAGIRSGPDPPPDPASIGCLRRAWKRFETRVNVLNSAFGQMLTALHRSAQRTWQQLRRCIGTAEQILDCLTRLGNRSLLGDYRCLRPAP